ncbi:outer membrane protein assembly factor BamE [Enterococcus sp. ALS3]|uniref:Outer membrane protein assembly factor BamE n=1 Tax=Enterococcus alishanensis TaxID=1303817 RepID=A0ABS6TDX5_9ENTE|nr:outer membrane protein assembly factor BamE [Enterococcus alishanensis]MBV7391092.1 outer membrane protein assembly factor BamE [Enterococcus alishanensis]
MKKLGSKVLLFALFLLLLSACSSNKVSKNDLSKISLDMSQQKVESILGTPSIKTTDRDELTSKYDSIVMIYASRIEFDKKEANKNRGYDEYSGVFNALKEKKNVELYVYTINKNEALYIYFIDGKTDFFFYLDSRN